MASLINSRVLSRFLPGAEGDATFSVYESLRGDLGRRPDPEAQRYLRTGAYFQDDDDDDVPDEFLYDPAGGRPPPADTMSSPDAQPSVASSPLVTNARRGWADARNKRRTEEDEDVPDSLLLDPRDRPDSSLPPSSGQRARAEAQWRAAQEEARRSVRTLRTGRVPSRRSDPRAARPIAQPNPHADATWLFTNAHDLDVLLKDVYDYFEQHGVWSMLLSRALGLLTELFVFSFTMFLSTCIDYTKLPTSKHTSEIMISQCMKKASWVKKLALFFFVIYWLLRLAACVHDIGKLLRMNDFYHHVLGISDQDLQTTSWLQVVDGLAKVANANVATANPTSQGRKYMDHFYRAPQQRLNAETIANRLMRKSNYYVAMYNKDVFDFTLPLPLLGSQPFYSKTLEWLVDMSFTNFIFDERGTIRPSCLDVKNRGDLIDTMQKRLRFTAALSFLVAPFNIARFSVLFFLRYYTEFTRNPSKASARSFTPFAEWKIRQFNELDHLFQKRLRQTYPFANEYLKQFPKDKTDQICKFVAFVTGSIAAVLTLATLFDPELFLGFEVTPGRTAVFWLTVMAGIFGVANGALPEESDVHDPVFHLKEVLLFMGTVPSHWKQRLHTNEVRAEFSAMYQMKVVIFMQEVLSFVFAPLILWRNSTNNCTRIVDFFREHTVHVEGIGHQCNFAVFNFKKDPNLEDPDFVLELDDPRKVFFGTKDDKLSVSMQNFRHYYSNFIGNKTRRNQGWQPPPAWPPLMQPSAIAEEGSDAIPVIGHARHGSDRKVGKPRTRHQPAGSAIYSPPQTARKGREKGAAKSGDHGKRGTEGAAAPGVSESRLMAQDSDLQDFADAPGLALESDTDVDDAGANGAGNAGVLGLLYQFSKAQTEKGPGAANI